VIDVVFAVRSVKTINPTTCPLKLLSNNRPGLQQSPSAASTYCRGLLHLSIFTPFFLICARTLKGWQDRLWKARKGGKYF